MALLPVAWAWYTAPETEFRPQTWTSLSPGVRSLALREVIRHGRAYQARNHRKRGGKCIAHTIDLLAIPLEDENADIMPYDHHSKKNDKREGDYAAVLLKIEGPLMVTGWLGSSIVLPPSIGGAVLAGAVVGSTILPAYAGDAKWLKLAIGRLSQFSEGMESQASSLVLCEGSEEQPP
jgi:hypothetical protein